MVYVQLALQQGTVIVWLQVAVLLHASVAIQVLVYKVGQEPVITSLPNCTGVSVPLQLSVAVGVTNVGLVIPQATVVLAAQVITGLVMSGVTVKLAAHVFVSHVLVTVNVTVLVPPAHTVGAAPPLLVTVPRLQPPLEDTEASQLLYALLISV
jgi:hypothetical protein